MCVGRNHWASYVAPLRRLRGLGAAVASGGYPADAAVSLSRLEAEAEQLWRWIDALLGLQPVSYISPTALTDLARLLGRAGQKSDARKALKEELGGIDSVCFVDARFLKSVCATKI